MANVRPLSDEDLSILALEHGPVVGHTCKVVILEEGIDTGELRESVRSRMRQAPELSLRLTEVDGAPWWAAAEQVDLEQHVVDTGEPALDDAGLRAKVASLFEQRLPRELPLWRIDVVPRLAGGGSALVWRIHHALADGTTAMRIARGALWNEPEADATPRAHARHADGNPPHRAQGLRAFAHEAPHLWERSPFDGEIDSKRSVAFATGDLDALHRVASTTCGATVNDAVLTVVSGGLRRWLEDRHCHVGAVRVKVPVSLHGADTEHGQGVAEAGNRDSYFSLDLPLGPADPAERLARIHRATRARKEDHDAQRLDKLMHELGECSPRLRRFADRVLSSPRSFALNVSNVPGPREPVDVLGVPARALYSIAEIRQHHALRIAVLSLCGTLRFGMCADPTLLPGVEQLADAIEDEARTLAAISVPT